MTTQPLYDILREAFDVGRSYEQTEYEFHGIPIGSQIIPLAARMEAEIAKLVEEEREACAKLAGEWKLIIANAIRDRSLPSSPERETKVV